MAESVQWAMLMPLVIVVIIGTIGICQLLAGRSAVQDAAFAGAEAGAIFGGDTTKASQAAQEVVTGSPQLADCVVDAQDGTDGQVVVTVTARVATFLPDGIDPTVHGQATRPKEG
jgi:Flp pilus assembly protein TadG